MRPTRSVAAVAAATLALVASSVSPAAAVNFGEVAAISPLAPEANRPQIEVSADGTRATAVWIEEVGGVAVARTASATVFAGIATWGQPQTISAAASADPQIALSADGKHAMAVWEEQGALSSRILTRSATVAGTSSSWGAATPLSPGEFFGEDAASPQVALSADGTRAVVVWDRKQLVGNRRVDMNWATVSGSTATWSGGTQLTSGDTGDAQDPQVGMSSDGTRFSAAWRRKVAGQYVVQSRSALWNGASPTLGLTSAGVSADGQNAGAPQLGLSADGGELVVAWHRFDGANYIAQSAAAVIDGTSALYSGAFNLSDPGANALPPTVEVAADGSRALVVWSRASILQSRTGPLGGGSVTWGPAENLNTGTSPFSYDTSLSDDGSLATVLWTETIGGVNRIFTSSATLLPQSAVWNPPVPLSSAGGDSNRPAVAMSDDGLLATAVWDTERGATEMIHSTSALASAQSIDFPTPPATRQDLGPVALAATASSGLPVSYATATPAVCSVAGSSAQLLAPGTCSIAAAQPGSRLFRSAGEVQRSFQVTAAPGPPSPATTLTVKARGAAKKLRLRKKAAVVTGVATNGSVTARSANCYRKGKKSAKACTIKKKEPGRILVTARCTSRVTARVTITAAAPGSTPVTWSRVWKVAKTPRKAC